MRHGRTLLYAGQWSAVSRCACCGRVRLSIAGLELNLRPEQILDLLAVLTRASSSLPARSSAEPS